MEQLANLVLSIVASLIAAMLVLLGTSLLSNRARWILTATLGNLLGIDIEYVFQNLSDAKPDIQKELNRAAVVKLLTARGNQFQMGTYDSILKNDMNRKKEVRILLPVLQPAQGGFDWVEQRELECAKFDSSFREGFLKKQIATTIESLKPYVESGRIDLRYYDAPHIARILVTDHCAYMTLYRKDAHGRDSRVIKYRCGGDMYIWCSRVFDILWDQNLLSPTSDRGAHMPE